MDPVAVIEQFLGAFARHDLEGMLAVLAVDAYFVPTGNEFAPAYGDFSGHDGWRSWWATTQGDKLSLDALKVEQVDAEHVLAELLIGAPIEDGWHSVVRVAVYTVRDGKVAAIEVFTDPDRAYERVRAGLSGQRTGA